MMKQILTVAVVTGCIVTGWVAVAKHMTRSSAYGASAVRLKHPPYDSARRDFDVRVHEAQVHGDPKGAIGWAFLSNAYLARSRERDSYADAVQSEKAARTSLQLRTMGNLGAQAHLVNSLLQQHRFLDALAATETAMKIWKSEPTLTELHADILIEIGRYREAAALIASHPAAFDYEPGKAVIAHLNMVEGHPEVSLKLLQSAYDNIADKADAPSDSIAWYQEKIGEALASMGRTDEAERAFERTVELYPRDYKGYANLAKIAMGRGNWQDAVVYGNKSNQIAPMPDILALVGDAAAQMGDGQLAEKQYRDVVALAGKPSGVADGLHEFAGASGGHGHTLDRQYAMFCADHGRDLDGGYACALRELQARRDIYAFDTMAWVCLKRGDVTEAKAGIDRALAEGTRDAAIYYHAGAIYAAAGNPTKAKQFYAKALATNKDFNALEAADCRRGPTMAAVETNVRQ